MNDNVRENLILVLYEQAEVEIKRNDYFKALSTLTELMELIKDRPEHMAHGGVKRLNAMIYKYQGKFYPALNSATEALHFYECYGERREMFRVRDLKGDIFFHFCKYPEAIAEWEAALELAVHLQDEKERILWKARTNYKLGDAYVVLAQYKRARSCYVKSLSYSRAIQETKLALYGQAGLGSTYHLENQFEMALQIYYRTLKLARKEGDQVLLGRLLHSIGDIFTKLGEFSRARKIYQGSLDISERNRDFLTSAATLRELGRLHLKDEPEMTVSLCEQSLDKLIENITLETRGQCERLMGKAFYLMALYHYNQKEQKEAMDSLVEAGEIFQRYNMMKERKRAEILYQELVGRPITPTPTAVSPKPLTAKLGIVNS